jgi:hypothetical protein
MRCPEWVALVDGNETQLGDMLECAPHDGVELTLIVDLIHVLEYVWKAAWAFHAEGSREAEQWVSERLLEILRGHASLVAGGMRRSATRQGLKAKERAAVDDCADHLSKYSAHLHYDEYLAAGLPIATGVIEGACRPLIQDRMGITGARWSLRGAEAVLRACALRSSGDFDEYWAFHQEAELTRNHLSRYAEGRSPGTQPPPKSRSGRGHRAGALQPGRGRLDFFGAALPDFIGAGLSYQHRVSASLSAIARGWAGCGNHVDSWKASTAGCAARGSARTSSAATIAQRRISTCWRMIQHQSYWRLALFTTFVTRLTVKPLFRSAFACSHQAGFSTRRGSTAWLFCAVHFARR